jgi:hypothetical protein
MAIMIPDTGPTINDSARAEPDIYWRLAKQLVQGGLNKPTISLTIMSKE